MSRIVTSFVACAAVVGVLSVSACTGGALAVGRTDQTELELKKKQDGSPTGNGTTCSWDGVVAYCAAHGIDSTKVMAVADGPNDIELLTNAAVRVVPKVAHPSALELASAIIPAAQDAGWSEVPSLL